MMSTITYCFRVIGLSMLAFVLVFVFPSMIANLDYEPFDLLSWQHIKRNGLLYILYYLLNIGVAALSFYYFKKKEWFLYLALILMLNFPSLTTRYYYYCNDTGERFALSRQLEKEDESTLRYIVLSNYLLSGIEVYKIPGHCEFEKMPDIRYPVVSGESYSLKAITRYEDSAVYFSHIGSFFVITVFYFLCLLWNRYFFKKQNLIDIEKSIKQDDKNSQP